MGVEVGNDVAVGTVVTVTVTASGVAEIVAPHPESITTSNVNLSNVRVIRLSIRSRWIDRYYHVLKRKETAYPAVSFTLDWN